MGSREKDRTAPLLSSLVVRPTESGGGGGGPGGGSDYEPGEVRRDPPPYSRSDRFPPDDDGYRIRAGSGSPLRRNHRYSPEFYHSGGPPRGRGLSSGRDFGRYREYSPPYGRGRGRGRFGGGGGGGGFSRPGFGPGHLRGEGRPGYGPNVRPREGDWICSDPACQNLNFARRDRCNNCNRFRYGPPRSPRRGYSGALPPHGPPRRFPGPPIDRSPGRSMNGSYRSPPPPRGGLARDFGGGGPPHARRPDEGRFADHHLRRDRPDFPEDDYRDRNKFDRPMPPPDWAHRDPPIRDDLFNERKGYERRLPSPPLPPALPAADRGRWARDERERSRSPPIRGVPPPPKDYRRDIYAERDRDDRRGMGRGRIGDAY